ncbi:MAG TPA: sialidase family protein [Opitutus sp.]|nr:sialidase family protein [Opitutus sp.]
MRANAFTLLANVAAGLAFANAIASVPPAGDLPPALRGVNPRTLSSGLFLSLATDGHFGGIVVPAAALAAAGGTNKGRPPAVLDARVGDNILLNPEPSALPSGQRSQAEPHLWRSAANSEVLAGTFQEGRYAAGGGALDCGYAISGDGGITWKRGLIPSLTTRSGGTYVRATDPVAAIDLNGNIYFLTLATAQGAFNDGGLVVLSRTTDGGTTFSNPVTVAAGAPSRALDKEWLAVNDRAGTPHANRLVATWTEIGSNNNYDLYSSTSDTAGTSWSTPVLIKPRDNLIDQATQPFFLPDGSLLVPYIANLTDTTFRIECKRSADGGTTYPSNATTVVSSVRMWTDPSLRSGTFLITAWVAQQTGTAFIAYVGLTGGGQPSVFVTKSTNGGATWSTPVAVSDNPVDDSVVNAAITATPDGQRVTVTYYDKRNDTGIDTLLDLYSNTSFDGGLTWQPGIRLTEYSTNFRLAPLTSEGYMLGDYQAIVPPVAAGQPAVAITVDAREGNPDPCIVRYALESIPGYDGWRSARFSLADYANAAVSGPLADPDSDGICNAAEYSHETNPRLTDYGSLYFTSPDYHASPSNLSVSYLQRTDNDSAFDVRWESTTDGVHWGPADFVPPTFGALAASEPDLADVLLAVTPGVIEAFREVFSTDNFSTFASGEILLANTNARLVNVSARGQVKTGESELVAGFVVGGGNKSILVRAIGPGLAGMDVPTPLPDPQISLSPLGQPSVVFRNDNWAQSDATAVLFARLGAFAIPADSLDAALTFPLLPQPYTVVVSDTAGRPGVGLAEIYDADASPGDPARPALVNLSARAEVGTGENILIGGFVIAGTTPKRVLLRAVGPTLTDQNVQSVLADPVLKLFHRVDSGEHLIATNDDWELSPNALALSSTAQRIGAFALRSNGSRDAALLLTLTPGLYTAQVSGYNSTSGIALVEIYDAD